jgi:hypothetical protein
LPAGYRGEFGPNLKSLSLLFSHLCNMSEPKIAKEPAAARRLVEYLSSPKAWDEIRRSGLEPVSAQPTQQR